MDDSHRNLSRRTAIKSLVGVSGLYSIGIVTGDNSDTVEIPLVKSGDETVRSTEVPAEWKNFEDKAVNTYEGLSERISDNSAVSAVAKGKDDRMMSGLNVSNVTVFIDPDSDSERPEIPSKQNGVNIEVIEREIDPEPMSCNTDTYEPIPGGVELSRDGGYGTSTQKVISESDDEFLLTAAHLFDIDGCDSVNGSMAQGNNSLPNVSGSGSNDPSRDVATIPYEDYLVDYGDYIHDEDEPTVNGYVSKQGVNYFKNNGTTVQQLGVSTCVTSGVVKYDYVKVTANGCEKKRPQTVFTNDTSTGDSGGPFYHKWNSSAGYRAATFGGLYGIGDGYSFAPAAWNIHENLGLKYDLT